MSKSKRLISLVLLILLAFSIVACGNGSNNASGQATEGTKKVEQTEIIIGTAGAGGTWYVVGSGIANVVSKHCPDIKMTASSTNGTVENMRLVSEGRIDIGMTQPPADYDAYNGINLYKDDPAPNLRFMCGGHYSIGHVVVPKNSPIKDISELKGKKVAIGVVGSGVRHFVGRGLLRLAGLDLEDITAVALNQEQTVDALKDGSVDAAVFSGGIPVPGLMNLAMVCDVRVLPIPPESIEKMRVIDPALWAALKYVTIPAGTYKGQEEDVISAGFITAFTVRDDVPEEIVYKILKTIDEYRDELIEVHPAGEEYTLEGLASGCCIDPHPGAVKFFKEKGIEIETLEK